MSSRIRKFLNCARRICQGLTPFSSRRVFGPKRCEAGGGLGRAQTRGRGAQLLECLVGGHLVPGGLGHGFSLRPRAAVRITPAHSHPSGGPRDRSARSSPVDQRRARHLAEQALRHASQRHLAPGRAPSRADHQEIRHPAPNLVGQLAPARRRAAPRTGSGTGAGSGCRAPGRRPARPSASRSRRAGAAWRARRSRPGPGRASGVSETAQTRSSAVGGTGSAATKRSAASACSEPSVATSIRSKRATRRLTTSTGQGAARTTSSDTLPRRARLSAPRPLAPTRMRSAFHDRAECRMVGTGRPSTIRTATLAARASQRGANGLDHGLGALLRVPTQAGDRAVVEPPRGRAGRRQRRPRDVQRGHEHDVERVGQGKDADALRHPSGVDVGLEGDDHAHGGRAEHEAFHQAPWGPGSRKYAICRHLRRRRPGRERTADGRLSRAPIAAEGGGGARNRPLGRRRAATAGCLSGDTVSSEPTPGPGLRAPLISALQGAGMHLEDLGGARAVAVDLGQHALDVPVLPAPGGSSGGRGPPRRSAPPPAPRAGDPRA